MENMRNIVMLKDLPSNLVEEAIVVLKQNQKIKKPEYIENKGKTDIESEKHKFDNYITKEAEMLIAEYISRMERNNKKEKLEAIKSKYEVSRNSRNLTITILFISLILNLI